MKAGEYTARLDLSSGRVDVTSLSTSDKGRWTGAIIEGTYGINRDVLRALDTALVAAIRARSAQWDRLDALETSALVTMLAAHAARVELARHVVGAAPTDAERGEVEVAAEILDRRVPRWADLRPVVG